MAGPAHRDGRGCPVRWSGRQAVAVLPGHLDVSNADRIGEQLLAVIGRGAAVVIVDMTATRSCDDAGARALARVHRQAVARGTGLRLVITAPVIRLAWALSRLDRPVSIYPTVAAAQTPDRVLLPSGLAGAGSDGAALPPDGAGPVSYLPWAGPAGRARPRLEDTLTQVTGSLLEAGLTLQSALDLPPDALRQAAGRVADLLDGAISQARSAVFAGHDPGSRGPDGAGKPDAAGRSGTPARPGRPPTAGDHTAPPTGLIARASRRTRSRSRELTARTLEAAAQFAVTQDRVAATLAQLALSDPRHLTGLPRLSQAAASHAMRIRQWAHEHAAAG